MSRLKLMKRLRLSSESDIYRGNNGQVGGFPPNYAGAVGSVCYSNYKVSLREFDVVCPMFRSLSD